MASSSVNDLIRAYLLGALGLPSNNSTDIDTLRTMFLALGAPMPANFGNPVVVGSYLWVPHSGAGTQIMAANGDCRYCPIYFSTALTISEWGIDITTGGSAGSLARFGVYAMGADGKPGTLIDDAGTQATTAIAPAGVTGRSIKVTPGWYFFATAQQGGAGTQATYRSANPMLHTPSINSGNSTLIAGANNALQYYLSTGITGAFASNPAIASITGQNPPRIQYKIASVP